jgi:hypothetical protein
MDVKVKGTTNIGEQHKGAHGWGEMYVYEMKDKYLGKSV